MIKIVAIVTSYQNSESHVLFVNTMEHCTITVNVDGGSSNIWAALLGILGYNEFLIIERKVTKKNYERNFTKAPNKAGKEPGQIGSTIKEIEDFIRQYVI